MYQLAQGEDDHDLGKAEVGRRGQLKIALLQVHSPSANQLITRTPSPTGSCP
jgi:hypothetical protein